MNRIEREKDVVEKMITIYCRHHHPQVTETGLCKDCQGLLHYAHKRLEMCPKGNRKGSCRKCEIHCYSPDNRKKIREVMRYVGPKMILIHPLSAIRHLINELK